MKRIFLSLLFIFQLSLGFCSDETPRFFEISDFSKGLNSHTSEFKLSSNQCAEAQNIRFNDKFGAFSKRNELLVAWDAGSSAITGLHRYYKSDGTNKTIIALGTTLKIGDSSATTTTTINAGLTDGKRWQFVTYKDVTIGVNGYDQPIKYDGHTTTTANTDNARTAGELCAQLGAPFAQLSSENGGNDLDASSWYQYKMAFYDGTVYSYSTARSNPILTGSTVQNITLTGIPIGPEGTTHRYIYRTLGAASQAIVEADTTFYLVADIADNTTLTIDDALADGDADDDDAPTWATASAGNNATPPLGSLCTINAERLFISGNKTYLSDVYWSDIFNPDYFNLEDYIEIRPDDGDKVTFLKTLAGVLFVGKTNTISKFTTTSDSDTNWTISDPYSSVGCPAPYSVDVSPVGILYAGRHGLYRFDGQVSYLISDAVTPETEDISQTNIEEVVGIYHDNEYHVAYTSVKSGAVVNDKELIYNLTRDAYTLDSKSINCYAAFNGSTDLGVLYSGSSTADGYVFAHTGSPISLGGRYQSDFDAGTYDDVAVSNTAENPILSLGWDCTVATWLTDLQAKNASINTVADITTYLPTALVARPDGTGTWTSPVYQIDASILDKLYWNETLRGGDITWQIRLDSDSDMTGIAWNTAVTNPNGSDISGITANNYIQLRANFSSSDITYSPKLYQTEGYVFKLLYSKVGDAYETSVLSVWESGWLNLGVEGYQKLIQRIKVFYEGTSGTLTFSLMNGEGDISQSFDINLATDPTTSINDKYTGQGGLKVYTWHPPLNSQSVRSPIGEWWKFRITENGIIDWTINKIQVKYILEEIYD